MITLAIIGVIAALTVPNLISSYRKIQAETGLRVVYSILLNAMKQAQIENGSITGMIDACVGSGKKQEKFGQQANCFVNNYLKPYLKYTESCDYLDKNCSDKLYPVVVYKNLDGGYTTKYPFMKPQYHSSLKLNNGMIIGVIWLDNLLPKFLVDINGSAGPNKTGVDVFHFELNKEQLNCFMWGNPREKWCNEDSRIGNACSCLIMRNSWNIPDDYPIKKF